MIRAKVFFAAAAGLLLLAGCAGGKKEAYLAALGPEVQAYTKAGEPSGTLARGLAVRPGKERKGFTSVGDGLYVKSADIVGKLSEAVREKEIYALGPVSVVKDTSRCEVGGLVLRSERVQVLGFDRINADGTVNRYRIPGGFVFGKYFALKPAPEYGTPEFRAVHAAVRNPFKGGRAEGCDFRPYPKAVNFAARRPGQPSAMPDTCRGIYLNAGAVGRIDDYIAMAKGTRLNTFVIDIKDDTSPGLRTEAMRRHSPTTFSKARAEGAALYEYAVRRIHEEGMWAVGRISCFKDSWLVRDNPSVAITEISTGQPLYHNRANWPSAFNRRVWQYNVELARECVRSFGFDEINFDYVRFPDRMNSIDHLIDFHNAYGESKCQAIQRFVAYACDELHEAGAYVSVDVFGEAANTGYVTAYGQYWPALSNIADVMCGMPYPDHFPAGYKGIEKPWNNPYETLCAWGADVRSRQEVTPQPAQTRTWIQAYHVMKHVDKEGIDYNAENMLREVAGLNDAGIGGGGFVAWLASSSLKGYTSKMDAYR